MVKNQSPDTDLNPFSASGVTSLSLSVPIYKNGPISVPVSQGHCEG